MTRTKTSYDQVFHLLPSTKVIDTKVISKGISSSSGAWWLGYQNGLFHISLAGQMSLILETWMRPSIDREEVPVDPILLVSD